MTLERLRVLEDVEAIRRLKARYLNACDLKDAETIRACFAEGEIDIDMGHVGVFTDREAFVELFVQAADHDFILDMHQGANPEIDVLSTDQARGRWSFNYRNVNTQAQTVTMASGLYDDEYTKQADGWRMSRSHVTYTSAVHLTYADAAIESVFTGRSVAGVVQYGGE